MFNSTFVHPTAGSTQSGRSMAAADRHSSPIAEAVVWADGFSPDELLRRADEEQAKRGRAVTQGDYMSSYPRPRWLIRVPPENETTRHQYRDLLSAHPDRWVIEIRGEWDPTATSPGSWAMNYHVHRMAVPREFARAVTCATTDQADRLGRVAKRARGKIAIPSMKKLNEAWLDAVEIS